MGKKINFTFVYMILLFSFLFTACEKNEQIGSFEETNVNTIDGISDVTTEYITESISNEVETETDNKNKYEDTLEDGEIAYIEFDFEEYNSDKTDYSSLRKYTTSFGDEYMMRAYSQFFPVMLQMKNGEIFEIDYSYDGEYLIAPHRVFEGGKLIAEYQYVKKEYGGSTVDKIIINGNEVEYFSAEAYPDSGSLYRYTFYSGFIYNGEEYEYRMEQSNLPTVPPLDFEEKYVSIYKGAELIGTYNFYGDLIDGPGLPDDVDTLIHYGFGNIYIEGICAIFDVTSDQNDCFEYFDGKNNAYFAMINYRK